MDNHVYSWKAITDVMEQLHGQKIIEDGWTVNVQQTLNLLLAVEWTLHTKPILASLSVMSTE